MFDVLLSVEAWIGLATLTALEIVLGIDNVIFLSIVSARLPSHQQRLARRIGLALAMVGRLILLGGITWIIGLTAHLFQAWDHVVSWRDLVLLVGGLFLIAKGTLEMHHMVEGAHGAEQVGTATLAAAIVQIVLLDLVFSLDSVITAVGMVDEIAVMVAAVVIAVGVMLVAAEPVSRFVQAHPTVKMLALSFLLLVGVALVADGLHVHVPRGYLYFAVAFSVGVEALNLAASKARARQRPGAA